MGVFVRDGIFFGGGGGGGGEAITLTQAQYDALSQAEKDDLTKVYYISDAPSGAGGVEYLNDLTDVQISNPQPGQQIEYDGNYWINYAAKIILTYAEDFQGEDLTCTNGTVTIVREAPSTGNLMTFYPTSTGTWTISGEAGGDTYEVEVTISELGEVVTATLDVIPDGETVTPTDDIETWLLCAGIKDKAYTTLTQVLGDSEIYNALLGDSNACAYMKRSTTFAGIKIPVMTSNTTPSGVVSASSEYSSGNYPAYRAFNETTTTMGWLPSSISGSDWVQYEFANAVRASKLKIKHVEGAGSGDYWTALVGKLQGSNDGTTFTDILDNISTPTKDTDYYFDLQTDAEYKYYKYIIKSTTPNGIYGYGIKIQLYTDGVTFSQYAMNLLGQYDTACDALLSDSTWASAIANSTYWESVLQPLVPYMTSNTAPSGVASANEEASGHPAWNAFDASGATTYWQPSASAGAGAYLRYEFPSTVRPFRVEIREVNNNHTTPKYKIQGTNDISSTWTDLTAEITAPTTEGVIESSVLTISDDYKYFQLLYTYKSSGTLGASVMQFYGRKSSGEKIHGGNPTYDSFYRIVDGNNVPVTDPSLLDAGTYTIYSNGLAKATDLTSDYGKAVRICPNTKEIVVRPDKTLYWWGYENPNLEDMTASNGWSYSGYSFVQGTHNNQDITLTGTTATQMSGVGSKLTVDVSKVSAIAQGITVLSGAYAFLGIEGTKTFNNEVALDLVDSSNVTLFEASASGNYYLGIYVSKQRSCKVSALWYE